MNVRALFCLFIVTVFIQSCHPEPDFTHLDDKFESNEDVQSQIRLGFDEELEQFSYKKIVTSPFSNEIELESFEGNGSKIENDGSCSFRFRLYNGNCQNCPTPTIKIEGYEQTNSSVPIFSETVVLTGAWHTISVSQSFVLFVTYIGCSSKVNGPLNKSTCTKPLELLFDEFGFVRTSSVQLPRIPGLKIWVAVGTWAYYPPYPKPGQGGKFICEDFCTWTTDGYVAPRNNPTPVQIWLVHTQTGKTIKGQSIGMSGGALNAPYYPIAAGENYHFVSWTHPNGGGPAFCFNVKEGNTTFIKGISNGPPLVFSSHSNCDISIPRSHSNLPCIGPNY